MRALEYLDKNRKLVKVLRILSQVGLWASAAAILILLSLAVYMTSTHSAGIFQGIPDNHNLVYSGIVIRLGLTLSNVAPQQIQTIVTQILFSAAAYACIFGGVLFFLSGILKNVENRLPFAPENARRISAMGVVFLVGSLVTGLAQAITAGSAIHALGLTEVMDVNYSINTPMLMNGLLMLILSGIFRYGAYLQEEYDATL